jgi:hypothetical protein
MKQQAWASTNNFKDLKKKQIFESQWPVGDAALRAPV